MFTHPFQPFTQSKIILLPGTQTLLLLSNQKANEQLSTLILFKNDCCTQLQTTNAFFHLTLMQVWSPCMTNFLSTRARSIHPWTCESCEFPKMESLQIWKMSLSFTINGFQVKKLQLKSFFLTFFGPFWTIKSYSTPSTVSRDMVCCAHTEPNSKIKWKMLLDVWRAFVRWF